MTLSLTPVSRETLVQRAEGLRRRIAAGDCPYPDEVGAANDRFLRRLRETPGADAGAIVAACARGAWIPGAVKLAGIATATATAALCVAGGPTPLAVASATIGGAAARALFRHARNLRLETAAAEKTADQVRIWEAWPTDAPPSVSMPEAPLTTEGLRKATSAFSREIAGFPYAEEARSGHARLLSFLDGRTIADARASLATPRPPATRVPEVIVTAAHAFSVVACGAGAGLLAAGHPLLAAGAFGAFLAREAVRLVEIHRGQAGAIAPQAAIHALDHWERAALPAAKETP